MAWQYLIALGSNVPHPRHGPPPKVLRAALAALAGADIAVLRASRVVATAPVGPSRRIYANGAAVIASDLAPRALLDRLHVIEAVFGRHRRGRRWAARTLDLDIVLWSGGAWRDDRLIIPHPRYATRRFVLDPALSIAGTWRDPLTGLRVKHIHSRLTRRPAAPKAPPPSRTRAPGP